MKRCFSILLVVVMMCTLCIPSFANEIISDENLIAIDSNNIWLYSEPCPNAVLEYAKENYTRFLLASIESNTFVIENSATLGEPFTIQNPNNSNKVYFFPVLSNDIVIGTYRVYMDSTKARQDDDTYSAIMSPYLASTLNELITNTTEASPAQLYFDNGNLMLLVGKTTYLLDESLDNIEPAGIVPSTSDCIVSCITRNITEEASIDVVMPFSEISKYISLPLTTAQGDDHYCAAHAAACLIRYSTGNASSPSVDDIMRIFYANPTLTDAISEAQVVYAANLYSIYPTHVYSRVNAYSYIDGDSPLYLRMRANVDGDHKYHAIVLRGYNTVFGTFSVWNPWHLYYETMDAASYVYTTSQGTEYTWIETIYGWPAP